jgi:Protein of unknown function (DUF559)
MAAILYAGRGSALSHATAASWWGLLPHLPHTADVCAPHRRRSLPTVRVHRARTIDRVRHRGLPVTTVARTLLDFAAVAPVGRLRQAVAEADYLRLPDVDAIDAVAGRGRAGSAALGDVLRAYRPQYARTVSPLEDLLLDLCQAHAIPLPEVNVMVAGYKVDALWSGRRLVAEVDGEAAHGTRARLERDRDRDLALRAAGYRVLRYTWRQVSQRSGEVATDLRRALLLGRTESIQSRGVGTD